MDTKKIDSKIINVIIAVAMLIIGILFLALRSHFVSALITVIGAMLIVYGIYEMLSKRYLQGGIEIAIGIGIIAMGWTIVDISLLILGIVLIIYAVYLTITTLPQIKSSNGKELFSLIATPILSIVLGVMLMVARWYMIDAIFISLGAVLIASGGVMLIKCLAKEKK